MRHKVKGKKFNRITGRRRSFMRALALNLIRAERIETTEARAAAVRPAVEKMMTLAKKQTLASRRLLLARLQSKAAVQKLCDDLAARYKDRKGGYLRVTKLAKSRKRDGGKVATIEFV